MSDEERDAALSQQEDEAEIGSALLEAIVDFINFHRHGQNSRESFEQFFLGLGEWARHNPNLPIEIASAFMEFSENALHSIRD